MFLLAVLLFLLLLFCWGWQESGPTQYIWRAMLCCGVLYPVSELGLYVLWYLRARRAVERGGKMPLQPCADTDQQRLLRSCDRAVRLFLVVTLLEGPARQRRGASYICCSICSGIWPSCGAFRGFVSNCGGSARFFCRCQLGAGYSACFRAVFCLTDAADTVRSLRIKTKDGPQGNAIAFPAGRLCILNFYPRLTPIERATLSMAQSSGTVRVLPAMSISGVGRHAAVTMATVTP